MDPNDTNWLFDLVHTERDNDARIAFYRDQIARFGEPVLELGSGSGTSLVALSPNLLNVPGLDAADEFASDPNASTDIHTGDMRSFNIEQKFRLIFAAGNSMQHLLTAEDLASCFDSVKRHLFPFGGFIAEVLNPSLPLLCRPAGTRYFVGEYRIADGWVVVSETVNYDTASQTNHVDWHYRNQYMRSEETVSFKMRQFFPQEFDAIFAANGFRVEAKYGDFDGSAFGAGSPKQIVVARPA